MRRGGPRGAANGRAKMDEARVRRFFDLQAEGWTLAELAARFGLSRSGAGDISSGRRWPHIKRAA